MSGRQTRSPVPYARPVASSVPTKEGALSGGKVRVERLPRRPGTSARAAPTALAASHTSIVHPNRRKSSCVRDSFASSGSIPGLAPPRGRPGLRCQRTSYRPWLPAAATAVGPRPVLHRLESLINDQSHSSSQRRPPPRRFSCCHRPEPIKLPATLRRGCLYVASRDPTDYGC